MRLKIIYFSNRNVTKRVYILTHFLRDHHGCYEAIISEVALLTCHTEDVPIKR
uniref:Uncharacterized protein n=1 Tax=Anguilla anguilla TaxID=7936 RepID=A0A0E9V6R3_ANGAN